MNSLYSLLILSIFILISCNDVKTSHKKFFEQFEQRLTQSDKDFMDTCSSAESFLLFTGSGGLNKYSNFFDSIPEELNSEVRSLEHNRFWPVYLTYAFIKYNNNEPYDLKEISIDITSRLDSQVKWFSNAINGPIRILDSNFKLLSLNNTIVISVPDSSYMNEHRYFCWDNNNWEVDNACAEEGLELYITKERYHENILLYKAKVLRIVTDSIPEHIQSLRIGETVILDIENYSKYIKRKL